MTVSELKSSLNKINPTYTTDKWLDLGEVSSIALSTATAVYPTNYSNGFKTQYFFDTNMELMYERIVDINMEDESLLTVSEYAFGENIMFPNDYPITVVIPIDLVSMIEASTPDRPRERYYLHG